MTTLDIINTISWAWNKDKPQFLGGVIVVVGIIVCSIILLINNL
jgi:hypothetical protein